MNVILANEAKYRTVPGEASPESIIKKDAGQASMTDIACTITHTKFMVITEYKIGLFYIQIKIAY